MTEPAYRTDFDADSDLAEGPGDSPIVLGAYSEHMGSIEWQHHERGALGLVLIDASPLQAIESNYGVQAHARAMQGLTKLLLEVCGPDLGEEDLVVSGERGADEVAIFLFRPREDDEFYREHLPLLADRLRDELAKNGARFVYPYHREAPFLPIGHAVVFHDPGQRGERAIRAALDAARSDAALNAQIEARRRRRGFLDLILSEDVTILYEPIVNLTVREVLGYEGLVRGPSNTPLHSPGALFEMAEETSLVFQLDCLCRRLALRGARGLEPGRKLFLNCLPTSIHDPAFRGDELSKRLQELRLRPSDVVFEISEKESIHNFTIFREARDYYAELGFKVALDDTGVAYGSLEAVMELSPDYIKLDMSLVRGVDTDPPRQALLRALHAVSGKIGAEVIAEGIETTEELSVVRQIGIPYGQGYLFGRPAPLRRTRA